MPHLRLRFAVTALAFCLVAVQVGAQGFGRGRFGGGRFGGQPTALQVQLQNADKVDCLFTQVATGDWNDAGPEIGTKAVEYRATFFDIDVDGGTAEAEGQFGDSYIVVRYAAGYLHFMQSQSAGPLYVTTVIAEPSGQGRLKAIQTRNAYNQVDLPGFTSRPEMYIGDCSVETAQD